MMVTLTGTRHGGVTVAAAPTHGHGNDPGQRRDDGLGRGQRTLPPAKRRRTTASSR